MHALEVRLRLPHGFLGRAQGPVFEVEFRRLDLVAGAEQGERALGFHAPVVNLVPRTERGRAVVAEQLHLRAGLDQGGLGGLQVGGSGRVFRRQGQRLEHAEGVEEEPLVRHVPFLESRLALERVGHRVELVLRQLRADHVAVVLVGGHAGERVEVAEEVGGGSVEVEKALGRLVLGARDPFLVGGVGVEQAGAPLVLGCAEGLKDWLGNLGDVRQDQLRQVVGQPALFPTPREVGIGPLRGQAEYPQTP